MQPTDHLRQWFTPQRLALVRCSALDRMAGRNVGTLSRFLKGQPGHNFTRSDLADYYSGLSLVGYSPPT